MASVKQLPSGKWQVRWRDPAGKHRAKSFSVKKPADRFAREVEVAKDHGTSVDHQKAKRTLGDYAALWEATRNDLALSTRERDHGNLTQHVLPAFGATPVGHIDTEAIEAWLTHGMDDARTKRAAMTGRTVDPLAPATRLKCLQLLRAVLDLARRYGAITVNPAADVKPPRPTPVRQTRTLTDAEAATLIDAAEVIDERTAGMVWVMLRAGLRFGEAAALKRADIDLAAGTLTVQWSLSRSEGIRPPKTAAGVRTLPMTADLAARLADHTRSMPAHIDGWLFTQPKGGPLDYNRWRSRRWLLITRLADLEGVNAHDLRHTCLTRLAVTDGWAPSQLQAFAGHSDPRTTLAVYVHVTADQLPTPSVMQSLM